MPDRPDPLDGLTGRQRRQREREDAKFIAAHKEVASLADPEALKVLRNTFAGTDIFKPEQMQRYDPARGSVDFIVCARCDLDHPIYFADNRFVACEDCGCDLQHRPGIPDGPRLCVCCAARRVREGGDG
jgi:hypothetical protein